MLNLPKLGWIITLSILGVIRPVVAADCAKCAQESQSLQELKNQSDKLQELLKANQDALSKIPSNATSQKIKISSNLVILVAKIETLSNQAQLKTSEMTSQKCSDCSKN